MAQTVAGHIMKTASGVIFEDKKHKNEGSSQSSTLILLTRVASHMAFPCAPAYGARGMSRGNYKSSDRLIHVKLFIAAWETILCTFSHHLKTLPLTQPRLAYKCVGGEFYIIHCWRSRKDWENLLCPSYLTVKTVRHNNWVADSLPPLALLPCKMQTGFLYCIVTIMVGWHSLSIQFIPKALHTLQQYDLVWVEALRHGQPVLYTLVGWWWMEGGKK